MPKPKIKAWSVAGQRIADKIKPGMPAEMVAQIEQQAREQAIADVYGANWKNNLDANGNPQFDGIGSTLWLMRVSEEEAEGHYSAIARWRGPAAAAAERERIARLKAAKK
jgi:hypothetical protein